jgi:hypothetical protein
MPENSKIKRLRSAALVKLKYEMMAGKLDDGFKVIYQGVLKDLSLKQDEVDSYIEKNKEELKKLCIKNS